MLPSSDLPASRLTHPLRLASRPDPKALQHRQRLHARGGGSDQKGERVGGGPMNRPCRPFTTRPFRPLFHRHPPSSLDTLSFRCPSPSLFHPSMPPFTRFQLPAPTPPLYFFAFFETTYFLPSPSSRAPDRFKLTHCNDYETPSSTFASRDCPRRGCCQRAEVRFGSGCRSLKVSLRANARAIAHCRSSPPFPLSCNLNMIRNY